MKCSLNVEAQLGFTKIFSSGLLNIAKDPTKLEDFSLETYVNYLVNALESKGKDREVILNYVSIIPSIIGQLIPLTQFKLLRPGLRATESAELLDLISDAQSIEELNEIFFEKPSKDQLKKDLKTNRDNKRVDQANADEEVNENPPSDPESEKEMAAEITLNAVPDSVLASTQQVIDEDGNIKPEYVFYNTFLADLSDMLAGDTSAETLAKMSFTDTEGKTVKGITVRMAFLSQVVTNINKRKQNGIDTNPETSRVMPVVIFTNKKGKPIYFKKEDNGKYTVYTEEEAREENDALPVYFAVRAIEKKNGRWVSKTKIQTPLDILQTSKGGKRALEKYKEENPDGYNADLERIDMQQQQEFLMLHLAKEKLKSTKLSKARSLLNNHFKERRFFLQGTLAKRGTGKSRKFKVADKKAAPELQEFENMKVFINDNLQEIIDEQKLAGFKVMEGKGVYFTQMKKVNKFKTKDGSEFNDVYEIQLKFKKTVNGKDVFATETIGVLQATEFDVTNTSSIEFAGISKGYIAVERTAETRTSSIKWESSDVPFNPALGGAKIRSTGINPGEIYIPAGNTNIPLQMDSISNEDINTINSLLFDKDLKTQASAKSRVKELSNEDRFKALATILTLGDRNEEGAQSHVSGIQYYPKTGKVIVDGVTIKLDDPASVKRGKELVKSLLTETVTTKAGKDSGYTRIKYKISNTALKTGGNIETYSIENGILKRVNVNILDFIKDNSIIRVVPLNNEIKYVNGYVRFGLSETAVAEKEGMPTEAEEEVIEKVTPKKPVARKKATPVKKDIKVTPPKFSETKPVDLTDRGNVGEQRTLDEDLPTIEDLLNKAKNSPELLDSDPVSDAQAKAWLEGPGKALFNNTGISFNRAFDVVNSNAFGTFRDGVISLWKGSDYTVAYHEAWHAFSQHFVTVGDKIKLYNYVAKTDSGKKALAEYAKEKQIDVDSLTDIQKYFAVEELIAEDFRLYMKSGGSRIIKGAPERNTIFRRILNFLKNLFVGKDGNQMLTEMYNNLRKGELNTYLPSQSNRIFGKTLNKFKPVPGNTHEFTPQDLIHANETISGYLSEVISDITIEKGASVFSLLVLDPSANLPKIYKNVQQKLEAKLLELEAEEELTSGEENAIKLISAILDNWGNSKIGMVANHLESIKYLDISKVDFDEDAFRITEEDQETMRFDAAGNDLSSVDVASKGVKLMLSLIPNRDNEGDVFRNELGAVELVPFARAWSVVKDKVIGKNSPEEMIEALKELIASFPWVIDIINTLQPVENINNSPNLQQLLYLRNSFFHSFNLAERDLHQVNINEEITVVPDGEGNKSVKRSHTIRTGVVSGVSKYAITEFRSMFASAGSSEFIVSTTEGNALDVTAVLDRWTKAPSTPEQKLAFLRHLGLVMVDVPAVREAIKNIEVGFLWSSLDEYNKNYVIGGEDNANFIMDPLTLLTLGKKEIYKIQGSTKTMPKVTVTSQSSTINALAEMHVKYSGNYANVALTTADGKQKYNTTLMSSLDVMVKDLNNVESYAELVNLPHMSHLKMDKFFMASANPILKSLFEYDEIAGTFGKRRKGIVFTVDDLTGVQTVVNELYADFSRSVVTAKMDRFTRIQSDIYSGLMQGKFSTTTHSDKSTTLTYYLNSIEGSSPKAKHLYVNPTGFRINDNTVGIEEAFALLEPYINGELERINKVKAFTKGEIELDRIPGVTVPHKGKMTGDKFKFISGIFTNSTLEDLSQYNDMSEVPDELAQTMIEEYSIYVDTKVDEIKDMLDGTLFVDANMMDLLNSMGEGLEGVNPKQKREAAEHAVLYGYVTNYFFHQAATVSLLYGDLTEYNMAKHDFNKRNAALAATGIRMFRTDSEALTWVNAEYKATSDKLTYAQKQGVADYRIGEVLRTAVIKDLLKDSVSMGSPEMKKQLIAKYKERGLNQTQAIEAADKLINYYKGMEVADAQGYVSFDHYRKLRMLSDRWSPSLDAIYYKTINAPETVTEEEMLQAFPPLKYQYDGPLATKSYNAHAFHKFSLVPLIPTVIEGTDLEVLHDTMIEQGLTYTTHKTGSKISDVVGETNELDDWHGYLRTPVDDRPARFNFTPNGVYLKYLKNQLDINTVKKGKVIFSTQMRKLIIDGMYNIGEPINQLSREKVDNYEKSLELFMGMRLLDLQLELGMDPEDPNSKPDNEKLLKLIIDELDAQDIAEHNLDYIKLDSQGNFTYDFSIGLNSLQIEHSLLAIVNNRLVRQKVLGEPLVQMSNAMMSKRKATADELETYGDSDLNFYQPNYFADGRTLGAESKISIGQGNFKQLFNLIDYRDGQKVGVVEKVEKDLETGKEKVIYNEKKSLERLNSLIQDETWRKQEGNIELVSLAGVRIPVQGHNSMVNFIVKEFLPTSAGSIIIPPFEIVAQSGSDFDIDKLSILMPHITRQGNSVKALRADLSITKASDIIAKRAAIKTKLVAAKKSLQEKRSAFDAAAEKAFKAKLTAEQFQELNLIKNEYRDLIKEQTDLLKDATEETIELIEEKILELNTAQSEAIKAFGRSINETRVAEFETNSNEAKEVNKVLETINSYKYDLATLNTKAFENEMLFSITDILALPQTFLSLITPNSTDMFTGPGSLVEELKKFRDYKSEKTVHKEDPYKDLQRVEKDLETGKNKVIYTTPATNILEPAYNMSIHEQNSVGKDVLGTAAVANTFNTLFARMGFTIPKSYEVFAPNGSSYTREVEIFLKANEVTIEGEKRISLASLYNQKGVKIADIINQIINGYVDVARGAWIFDVQGNKQLAPVLLFLIQAGVPVEQAVYFLSNPAVKEYARLVKKYSSPFTQIKLEGDVTANKRAKTEILKNFGVKKTANPVIFGLAKKKRNELKEKKITEFKEKYLKELTSTEVYDRQNFNIFLHFLELQDHSKHVTSIVTNFNNDTTRQTELYGLQQKETEQRAVLSENPFFSETEYAKLLQSPIGSFFRVNNFQNQLWSDLFTFSADTDINDIISDFLADYKQRQTALSMFGDIERFAPAFKKDFLTAMFIGELKQLDFLKKKEYKGMPISNTDAVDLVAVSKDENGNVSININEENLKTVFDEKLYTYRKSNTGQLADLTFQKQELATLHANTFSAKFGSSFEEFVKFNIERELIKLNTPVKEYAKTENYKIRNAKIRSTRAKRTGESEAAYNTRLQRITYREYLRDTALNNIHNLYAMFGSKSTAVSTRLYNLQQKYPSLAKSFNLFGDLIPDVSKPSKATRNPQNYYNIKLKDNRVEKTMFSVYAANILDLMNPETIPTIKGELTTAEQKQEIADFFKDIATIAVLQSGYDTSNPLSLIKAVPEETIIKLVQQGLNKHFNTLELNDFLNEFIQQNSKDARNSRRRMKAYIPLDVATEKSTKTGGLTENLKAVINKIYPGWINNKNNELSLVSEFKALQLLSQNESSIKDRISYGEEAKKLISEIKKGKNPFTKDTNTKEVLPNLFYNYISGELAKDGISEKDMFLNLFNTTRTPTQSSTSVKVISKSKVNYTRESVKNNPKTLYIFTDNTDRDSGSGLIPKDSWYSKKYGEGHHYPTITTALIRGLDNARPISTQRWYNKTNKGVTGRWNDSDINEFKAVISDEISEIKKAWDSGKYTNIVIPGKDGFFNSEISNISKERTPALYSYLEQSWNNFEQTLSSTQSSTGVKGFKLSIDKKGKDQGKADLANRFIGYGVSGTSTYQYQQDAKKAGIPLNYEGVIDESTVAFVSVNGNNKASEKAIYETIENAREVLENGGTIVMDSTFDATRTWNQNGEALVQEGIGEPSGQTSKGYNYWGNNPESLRVKSIDVVIEEEEVDTPGETIKDPITELKEIFSNLDAATKKKLGGVTKIVKNFKALPFEMTPQDYIEQEINKC
jgi:hypothetical protein